MTTLTKTTRTILWLAIFLFSLLGGGQNTMAQEIPNGDGDLLWERDLGGRFVNDAKFHPINGNIIAAVNHEIWEIDPKDGKTIRKFEGGPASGEYDQFTSINISSDGNTIVTDEGSGIKGIIIWDYPSGKIRQNFDNGETISDIQCTALYPDNNRVIFFSFVGTGFHLNIYDIQKQKLILQKDIYPYSPDFFRISNNGRYIAFGFRYKPQSDMIYTMELWDAETLTKIKDFGEVKAGGFKDIQISENNNYIGFLGLNRILFLINQEYNSQHIYEGAYTFAFSNDSKKILVQRDTAWGSFIMYFHDLANNKPLYQYKKQTVKNFRFNKENQLLGGDYVLKFWSNNWYTVNVRDNLIELFKVNYAYSLLKVNFPSKTILIQVSIIDSIGRVCYQESNLSIENEFSKKIGLTSGIYLIKLTTSTGEEITQKFIVNN